MTEKTMTTYRRADGEPVAGEFTFVMDTEFFTDSFNNYAPTEVVREIWVLLNEHRMTIDPDGWEPDEDEAAESQSASPDQARNET